MNVEASLMFFWLLLLVFQLAFSLALVIEFERSDRCGSV